MHRSFRLMSVMLLVVVALLIAGAGWMNAVSAEGGGYRLALPLSVLTGRMGKAPSILGGVLAAEDVTQSVYTASQSGISWTRYNQYRWDAVETAEGERNWAGQADAETRLIQMSAAGLTPILVIHGTPTWAQAVPGYSCGAVSPDDLDAFGDFMFDVVERFSQPPYNVHHYEFYDKPDIDPTAVMEDSAFGCWGDDSDETYYGGDTYGEMLAAVSPRMKEANPDAQVLIGGLLLNCDYHFTYDPARDCASSKFLSGVLNTGAEAFDIVAYQSYPFRASGRFDWDHDYYLWQHRGGVLLGKLDFIQEEFAAADVPMKPVFVTEAGLTCFMEDGCENEMPELQADQANYVMRLYARATANDIEAVLWSTFSGPGWRDTGILDEEQNPRPAYRTFQLLSWLFGTTIYTGSAISNDGDVEQYTFTASDNSGAYTIYFSNSDNDYSVPLPEGTVRLLDQYGDELPLPTDGNLTVTFAPVVVETDAP